VAVRPRPRSDGRVKTLLVSAPHRDTFGYSMPPPGLLRLGAAVRRAGLDVRLDDLAFRLATGALPAGDDLAATAARRTLHPHPPDVLGLSVMGATVPIALAIAREVRRCAGGVQLVLGGPGVHGIESTLIERFPWIDAVVRGDGEETFPALLAAWGASRDADGVAGVTWRDAAGKVRPEPDRPLLADLDAAGTTAWELLPPLAAYKAITGEPEGLVPIDSGRGCVYDCSFCSIGRTWRRRSRTLSPAALVREMEVAAQLEGARNAYLCHDLFGADRRAALAFCELLTERGSRMPWECRGRADHLDAELLGAMARAGCYRVLLGIESADPEVRAANQKGMRTDIDLLAVVSDCAAAGITPILSLILGLPGEDDAALRRSLDFCARASLRAGVNLSLHLPNPQPGCRLGDELGARSRPVEGIPPDMAWGAGETAPERELIEAHPDLFSTWALLPLEESRLHELHGLAESLPELLMRYPFTFSLLGSRLGDPTGDTLDTFRAWRACGRSFEAFAAAGRDPLTEDVLRWEQARVRVGARNAEPAANSGEPTPTAVPVAAGETLELAHDIALLVARGREGAPLEAPARRTRLAVVPTARGVTTSRISADVARILRRIEARASLGHHEREAPGLSRILAALAGDGLVRFEPSR